VIMCVCCEIAAKASTDAVPPYQDCWRVQCCSVHHEPRLTLLISTVSIPRVDRSMNSKF
jgi:hypothetical protein